LMLFECVGCSHVMKSERLAPSCERCGGALLITGRTSIPVSRDELESLPPGVWRYHGFLPPLPPDGGVTLGEGGTPMLHAERLGKELGLRNLLVKDETRNPTGSFLDRGTTVLVSFARARGVKECSCDTTGNLGASLAAYCAKAGIKASIRVRADTDQGKLYQMLAYGAEIASTPRRRRYEGTLEVSAANPYLLEGEKTTGFEIVQELEWEAPDMIIVPVGTGGHLSMIERSIEELETAGLERGSRCKLVGVQLKGPATKEKGGRPSVSFPLAELSESKPFFRKEAAKAMEKSGGFSISTTPDDTIAATGLLAKTEGIFAEPSAASVVAGLAKGVKSGQIVASDTVVCVITGAGLKDTKSVLRIAKEARSFEPPGRYVSPSIKVGETKLAILLLLRRPNYAYRIWQDLKAERDISTASIYQHLLELEEFSMVRKRGTQVVGGRERVVYELTRKGGDYLRIAGKLQLAEGPRER
jgi:threonine synthase